MRGNSGDGDRNGVGRRERTWSLYICNSQSIKNRFMIHVFEGVPVSIWAYAFKYPQMPDEGVGSSWEGVTSYYEPSMWVGTRN